LEKKEKESILQRGEALAVLGLGKIVEKKNLRDGLGVRAGSKNCAQRKESS